MNAMKKLKIAGIFCSLILSIMPVQASTIFLDGTIRDFLFSHPDFENDKANGSGLTTGLVDSLLGADGKPVYIGGNTLSTKSNFDQWFNDVAGVNKPLSFTFTLDQLANGFFSYTNQAYFPIDGLGFGNEATDRSGNPRNYSFTTEINTKFVYSGFNSQLEDFIFTGDDDVWVFVNGELVVDLGGTHGPKTSGVDLDSLGLTLGETYSLDIFQAERQTSGSTFSFSSAAKLQSVNVPEPASILLFSMSLLFLRLRRK